MRGGLPAQQCQPGHDPEITTPVDNVLEVGDGVKPYGWIGTTACAETARLATEILDQPGARMTTKAQSTTPEVAHVARPHLREVLAPRRVAVVGASRNPKSLAGRYLDHLLLHDFPGEIVPINRSADEVRGLRAYPSLEAMPEPVDLALVTVPGEAAFEAARSATALEIPLTVLFTSGFAETGAEGRALQAELSAMFASTRSRMLGPNCPGFVNVGAGVAASVSAFVGGHKLPQGSTGIVSQSGAVGGLIAERLLDIGTGISHVIFTGNEADTEIGEAVETLATDPECRVVALFVEGLGDPDRAVAGVAAAVDAGKPVFVLSTGRSEEGRQAAALHTGKLIAVGQAERALFRQAGAVLVDDLTTLAEACAAVATGPRRTGGPRVGIVSTTGGLGGLAADQVRDAGGTLPPLPDMVQTELAMYLPHYASTANPCDLADALTTVDELLQHAVGAFSDSGQYDALVVTMAVHPDWLADRLAGDLVAAAAATPLPIVVLWPGGSMGTAAVAKCREGGLAVTESAAACGAALAGWMPRVPVTPVAGLTPAAPATGLHEDEVKVALAAAGLRIPGSEVAGSAEQAAEAHSRLGGVAVMKALEPVVDHKARLGLVRRGIATPEQAAGAWQDFERHASTAGLTLETVLLEQEVHDLGIEVLLSCHRSPLGLEVLLAPGGGAAELAATRPLRFGPVSEDTLGEMGAELGIPDALLGGLWTAFDAVQRLALAYGPDLDTLEVNPVLLTADGPVALDAKLRLGEPA